MRRSPLGGEALVAELGRNSRPCDAAAGNYGYNAATERFGDLVEMGVIDPTKVARLGLQNAASIAGLILTTDCVIVEPPKGIAAAGRGARVKAPAERARKRRIVGGHRGRARAPGRPQPRCITEEVPP